MTAVVESPIAVVSMATASVKSPEIMISCKETFTVTSQLDRASFYRAVRNFLGPEFLRTQGGCVRLSEYTKSLWKALQRRSASASSTDKIALALSAEDGFSQLSERVGVELPGICDEFLHTKSCADPSERVVLTVQGKRLVFEQGVVAA